MSDPALRAQLNFTLSDTHFDALGTRYRGKVRDVYRKGDRLFLIATDRLSAFDKVLTTIPFKGEVLNRLAQFWFEKTAHVAKNHVLDVPDPNVTVARATSSVTPGRPSANSYAQPPRRERRCTPSWPTARAIPDPRLRSI